MFLEGESLGPEDDVAFLVGFLGHAANLVGSHDAVYPLKAVIIRNRHRLVKVILGGLAVFKDMGGSVNLGAVLGAHSDVVDVGETSLGLEDYHIAGEVVLDVKLVAGCRPPLEGTSESPVKFRDSDRGDNKVLKGTHINLVIVLHHKSAAGQAIVAIVENLFHNK